MESSQLLLVQRNLLHELKSKHASEADAVRLRRQLDTHARREQQLVADVQTEKQRVEVLQQQLDEVRAAAAAASKRSEQEFRWRDEAAASRAAAAAAKGRLMSDHLKKRDELLCRRDMEIRKLKADVQAFRRKLQEVELEKQQCSFIDAQRATDVRRVPQDAVPVPSQREPASRKRMETTAARTPKKNGDDLASTAAPAACTTANTTLPIGSAAAKSARATELEEDTQNIAPQLPISLGSRKAGGDDALLAAQRAFIERTTTAASTIALTRPRASQAATSR